VGRFRFLRGRLLQAVPVVIGVTVIAFFILRLIPGDPTSVMLGAHWTPARAAVLRHNLGLDRSIAEQYRLFIGNLFKLNLGDSIYYHQPVSTLIADRLPVTLWLAVYSTVLAIVISVPLATLSALRRNGVVDQTTRVSFLIIFAMPPFWVGLILVLLFGLKWRLFPVSGYGTGVGGHLYHLFLPALTIALGFGAILTRTLRNSVLGVLQADYLDTARAKGLGGLRTLNRHVLRNALISAVTVIGVNLAYLVGSTVIIENVFALPGLGQLLASSINTRDLSVVQGIILVFGFCVVAINLLTDVAYAVMDPQVSFD
jgi:peptide/nickel transport system permease protein